MTVSNRLNQLVELAGNISNAFTIADNGKTISQLIGVSLHETTSEFFSKITTTL
tara:strand:+ start:175 stop:336 length:162 start_codon:yes stop_codon:yes gene_type:complete